jgi:hypothetical protein
LSLVVGVVEATKSVVVAALVVCLQDMRVLHQVPLTLLP